MVKLLSLFSGIGAFEKALTNLGIPFELIAYCEFDKYASKAYSVIHNVPESMNLGDITQVDEKTLPVNVVDILTYGFPCQPFSVAGRQEGFADSKGRGKSSSQLYKLAGNSISVPLLEFIFCQMFDDQDELWI